MCFSELKPKIVCLLSRIERVTSNLFFFFFLRALKFVKNCAILSWDKNCKCLSPRLKSTLSFIFCFFFAEGYLFRSATYINDFISIMLILAFQRTAQPTSHTSLLVPIFCELNLIWTKDLFMFNAFFAQNFWAEFASINTVTALKFCVQWGQLSVVAV